MTTCYSIRLVSTSEFTLLLQQQLDMGMYTCGHVIEDNDFTHNSGCSQLSRVVQSSYDDTANLPKGCVGRLGSSATFEGQYTRLVPCISRCPQACSEFSVPYNRNKAMWLLNSRWYDPWPLGMVPIPRVGDLCELL
jgi:hypothetical protein